MKSNRAFTALKQRLQEHTELFRPWKGTIYRVTTLKYRDPREILLREGSYRYRGRWNAIVAFHAVYGSTDDFVALAESKANADYANLPYPFSRAASGGSSGCVALSRCRSYQRGNTESAGGVRGGIAPGRLAQGAGTRFESFTQALGRALFKTKAEGLIARSARTKNGINIAYFPENKLPGSKVQLWDAQELHDLALE